MAKELKYRIVVVGQRAAMSVLQKFQRGAVRIFSSIGRAVKAAFKIGVVGGIAGIIGTGVAAIKAASNYEQLRNRLEAVLGSAKKARDMFKELRDFAASTPLQLEDLVKAKIILEGVGVTGMKAFQGVAETSAAMGKSIEEVALAVASLENETLKRLGIQLRNTGDQFKFTFRDKAGMEIERTVDGINEARLALTDIFSTKFGGGLQTQSESLFGRLSTFTDKMKEVLAQIGEQLLPPLKTLLTGVNAELDKLAGSGLLSSGEGIKKLFIGAADVLFAAIVDGGKIAGDLIYNALTRNKTPLSFIMQANAQNALLPDAVKRLRGTISKGAGSAGADPAKLAEINALPKIMSQNATGVVGAAGAALGRVNVRTGGIKMNYVGGARRSDPGSSAANPLYVEEVKPEGAGLL